jgi:pyruvate dehydrogenase E2 component (dihydrolipoamide acetyltransferase)
MDEGTFVGWLKQDGAWVKAGEPLFTLEGDKASQDVEATESGMLRIAPGAPKPGEAVSVGTLLGYLAGEQEDCALAEAPPRSGAETKPGNALAEETSAHAVVPAGAPTAPGSTATRIAISPRARRRAAELGLDYRGLQGSGRSGRIREADVLAAAKAVRARVVEPLEPPSELAGE